MFLVFRSDHLIAAPNVFACFLHVCSMPFHLSCFPLFFRQQRCPADCWALPSKCLNWRSFVKEVLFWTYWLQSGSSTWISILDPRLIGLKLNKPIIAVILPKCRYIRSVLQYVNRTSYLIKRCDLPGNGTKNNWQDLDKVLCKQNRHEFVFLVATVSSSWVN